MTTTCSFKASELKATLPEWRRLPCSCCEKFCGSTLKLVESTPLAYDCDEVNLACEVRYGSCRLASLIHADGSRTKALTYSFVSLIFTVWVICFFFIRHLALDDERKFLAKLYHLGKNSDKRDRRAERWMIILGLLLGGISVCPFYLAVLWGRHQAMQEFQQRDVKAKSVTTLGSFLGWGWPFSSNEDDDKVILAVRSQPFNSGFYKHQSPPDSPSRRQRTMVTPTPSDANESHEDLRTVIPVDLTEPQERHTPHYLFREESLLDINEPREASSRESSMAKAAAWLSKLVPVPGKRIVQDSENPAELSVKVAPNEDAVTSPQRLLSRYLSPIRATRNSHVASPTPPRSNILAFSSEDVMAGWESPSILRNSEKSLIEKDSFDATPRYEHNVTQWSSINVSHRDDASVLPSDDPDFDLL